MTPRFLLIAAAVTTMLAGPAAIAAHADVAPNAAPNLAPTAAGSVLQDSQMRNAYGDWFCVVVYGTGVCQGDPLPDQLPVPQLVLPPLPLV